MNKSEGFNSIRDLSAFTKTYPNYHFDIDTVAHNIKSLNVSFSASRSSIKVNLGEDNNVTVSTETPYRLAAVQDVSKGKNLHFS